MLPLSYVEESDMFVFFPGEMWKNKTWIERTPIYLRDRDLLSEILSSCPQRTYLRYIDVPEASLFRPLEVDEIGYVLYPSNLGPDLASYRSRFSSKKFSNKIID